MHTRKATSKLTELHFTLPCPSLFLALFLFFWGSWDMLGCPMYSPDCLLHAPPITPHRETAHQAFSQIWLHRKESFLVQYYFWQALSILSCIFIFNRHLSAFLVVWPEKSILFTRRKTCLPGAISLPVLYSVQPTPVPLHLAEKTEAHASSSAHPWAHIWHCTNWGAGLCRETGLWSFCSTGKRNQQPQISINNWMQIKQYPTQSHAKISGIANNELS